MNSLPKKEQEVSKQELRKHYRDVRAEAFGKLETLIEEANIQSQLIEFISTLGENKTVSFYYPIDFEIDIIPVLKYFDKKKKVVCLPVVKGGNSPLEFRKYQPDDQLNLNETYKIKEPTDCAEIVIPDVMIVPLVAFDKEGYRLGFGKGFYDRTIEEVKEFNSQLITIGVGYSLQYYDGEFPINDTDQKLDFILTGKEVLEFTK